MKCHACPRTNAGHRRYCGGCGANLSAPCSVCGFGNTTDDRYCGGCGGVVGTTIARVSHAQPVSQPGANELAGLFDRPAPPPKPSALPQSGIGQDDLDRLFGVGT